MALTILKKKKKKRASKKTLEALEESQESHTQVWNILKKAGSLIEQKIIPLGFFFAFGFLGFFFKHKDCFVQYRNVFLFNRPFRMPSKFRPLTEKATQEFTL